MTARSKNRFFQVDAAAVLPADLHRIPAAERRGIRTEQSIEERILVPPAAGAVGTPLRQVDNFVPVDPDIQGCEFPAHLVASPRKYL